MSEETEMTWLDHTGTVDDLKWIKGYGPLPCEIMVIGERPGEEEMRDNAVFTGPGGRLLFSALRGIGFDESKMYFTNAVKYVPPNKRAINAGDIKKCKAVLMEEIKRANPKIVLCLGAVALKAVMGKNYKLGDYRSSLIDYKDGIKLFTTFSPAYILRYPEATPTFTKDLQTLYTLYSGKKLEQDKTEFEVLTTAEQVRQFKDYILMSDPAEKKLLFIDAEWHGLNWMSPKKYIRTLQIGYRLGAAVVINFTDPGGVQVMDDPKLAWQYVKELLTDPMVEIAGHNVISDGEWLMQYGVDIRENVVFDTMLAEHVLNESGPFGLEELTLKYTNMGRYDLDLQRWKNEHAEETELGYGPIPNELLHPYGAKDVDGPRRIAIRQIPLLEPFMTPRGPHGEYPSLWDIVMATQKMLYEIEMVGMYVDKKRLDELIKVYNERLGHVVGLLTSMVRQIGMENFNHASPNQVRDLLFVRLQLDPIKTTKGRKWPTDVKYATMRDQLSIRPSTDKNTLEILQDHHPIVKTLMNVRKLDMAVKYFLKEEEEEDVGEEVKTGGGIISKIWPDGRLHPHFSQLSETARFKTSKPNCQNWPKKAEGYMVDIFGGKDKVPPLIRTIIIPTPGYVLMEGDFVQAELFVLAALSHDKTMWEALTTPGKDLHDLTAVTSFKLRVLGPDGVPIEESFLLNLAKEDKEQFKKLQEQLIYLDQRGKRMTRDEFKSGIRVSSKNLNFGIP